MLAFNLGVSFVIVVIHNFLFYPSSESNGNNSKNNNSKTKQGKQKWSKYIVIDQMYY